jgi:hypothetical protein
MSIFDLELRYRLVQYLSDDLSLRDLRRWFLPKVWDLSQDGQLRSPLARRLELRLAEYVNGHWTEDDLRGLLAREVPTTTSLSPPFRPTLTGSVERWPPRVAEAPSQLIRTAR